MAKKRYLVICILVLLIVTTACNKKTTEVTNSNSKAKVALQDTSFLEEMERKNVNLEFKQSEINPKVKDYDIKNDLSNVENIDLFGKFIQAQQDDLVENGFVITKTKNIAGYDGKDEYQYDQLYQIYEANEYMEIPSFVTTDSVTHIFHIFYDNFLRTLEREKLYPELQNFNQKLLATNIDLYNNLKNEELKKIQLKNVAFLATGARLMNLEMVETPKEANAIVDEELKKVENEALDESPINNFQIDYSQLKPRGHYTRSKELEKYFKSTMYYGQVGFFPKKNDEYDRETVLQSMLLTYSIYNNKETLKSWENLVGPIDFLVETADDISIKDYARILYGIYGKDIDIDKIDDEEKLKQTYNAIDDLPMPQIAAFQGKSFRLIPQRSVIDNILLQNTVDVAKDEPSKRPIYSGLDLMSTFDNKMAKKIQKNDDYNKHWDKYEERIDQNIKIFNEMHESDWQKNLYRGWLWMLSSYNKEFREGYPKFMQNESWQKKDLVSALGSYAEMKHDTILYGKSVMAEAGGGMDIESYSYVEPNIDLYEKLSWLIEYTKINLKDRDILDNSGEEKLDNFKEMVDFLILCSKKELNNEVISEEENQKLAYIGGWMEMLMIDFVESVDENSVMHWYEISNPQDRRMPIVADLMRVARNSVGLKEGDIFSIATGKPAEIYVIYPVGEKLYMGRGGVFTYYEFVDNKRLDDKEWQEMVFKDEKEYPSWYKDIIKEEKPEFEGGVEAYW